MFVKKLWKATDGFTLVEMTVVIAIIAVLAALALPAVTGVTTTSRGTSKTGDQKETQQGVLRYEDANSGALPSATNTADTDFDSLAEDADFDGNIDILVNNITDAGGTTGTTPSVDVTCQSTGTDAALLECFGAISFSSLVPDFLSGPAKHSTQNVTATATNSPDNNLTGDSDITTADFTIENCDLAGSTCRFYLENGESLANLRVWNVNQDNTVFTFKEDDVYGK